MKTMNIEEAAHFLRLHPVTLYRMVKKGEIPAAKPGKQWVFVDLDLVEWLRAKYALQASQGDSTERSKQCHSIDEEIRPTGGISLPMQTASAYKKALGLAIK